MGVTRTKRHTSFRNHINENKVINRLNLANHYGIVPDPISAAEK